MYQHESDVAWPFHCDDNATWHVQQDQEEADAVAEREHNLVDGVHLNGYRSPRAGHEQDDHDDDSVVYFINAYAPDELQGSGASMHDSLIFMSSRVCESAEHQGVS